MSSWILLEISLRSHTCLTIMSTSSFECSKARKQKKLRHQLPVAPKKQLYQQLIRNKSRKLESNSPIEIVKASMIMCQQSLINGLDHLKTMDRSCAGFSRNCEKGWLQAIKISKCSETSKKTKMDHSMTSPSSLPSIAISSNKPSQPPSKPTKCSTNRLTRTNQGSHLTK